jgi:hypothetical protein
MPRRGIQFGLSRSASARGSIIHAQAPASRAESLAHYTVNVSPQKPLP